MTELIIESIPSGAEVTFDGKVIGTTPLTHTIDEPVGLAEFRAECLSGGNVVCSWDVLKTRLEDQTVSRLWWMFTETERRSIAEHAIKNTLFFRIGCKCGGLSNCLGSDGEWSIATCLYDVIVKYPLFAECEQVGTDACYWKNAMANAKDDENCDGYHDEFCVRSTRTYGLPCNVVFCSPIFGHVLMAIQVVEGTESLDNWVIFQYGDYDIKPGHWQMPIGQVAKIWRIKSISCKSIDPEQITEFSI